MLSEQQEFHTIYRNKKMGFNFFIGLPSFEKAF